MLLALQRQSWAGALAQGMVPARSNMPYPAETLKYHLTSHEPREDLRRCVLIGTVMFNACQRQANLRRRIEAQSAR